MIDNIIEYATHGFNAPDLASFALRSSVGIFFAISGYHKLFHAGRREGFIRNLQKNKILFLDFNKWFVPGVEFIAGLTLLAGLFTSFSALMLLAICFVATCCEAWEKVLKYQPIDGLDVLDDYLYLPEVLYAIMLIGVILNGTGHYSLDRLLFP